MLSTGYKSADEICSFAHKGMQRFYSGNNAKGFPAGTVDKLRRMFAFIEAMHEAEELRSLASWKVHTQRPKNSAPGADGQPCGNVTEPFATALRRVALTECRWLLARET